MVDSYVTNVERGSDHHVQTYINEFSCCSPLLNLTEMRTHMRAFPCILVNYNHISSAA